MSDIVWTAGSNACESHRLFSLYLVLIALMNEDGAGLGIGSG